VEETIEYLEDMKRIKEKWIEGDMGGK